MVNEMGSSSAINEGTKVLGLRTVMYHVGDMLAAKEWYSKVLGSVPYFDQPEYYIGFNVCGYELGLHPDLPGQPKGDSAYAYWGVNDCQSTYERLLALGAKPNTEPIDVGEGIVVATVLDPWGNVFGIIRNPHFKLPE
jgi:predicted enzyme related to lactoylglutathione lyase